MLRDSGRAAPLISLDMQGFIGQGFAIGDYATNLNMPMGSVFLQNSCKLVWPPLEATSFCSHRLVDPALVLGPHGEVTTMVAHVVCGSLSRTIAQAAGTDILRAIKHLNEARGAELQDGQLRRAK